MASFNKVILLGNLTRDPEVKYTSGGTAVCELSLAINHTWKDSKTNEKREEVTFVEVTFFGRTAEVAGEYLQKGNPAMIEGRLKLERWHDRETGKPRQKMIVIGEGLQLLGSKGGQKYASNDGDSGHSADGHMDPAEAARLADESPF